MYFLRIKFFDSTLRDGSHAVKQQLYREQIEAYCSIIDNANMHTVIVGHGNGLGASSIQMGMCAMPEMEMLEAAKSKLNKTQLGTFVTVGFGTVKEQIIPAINKGAELFCIASHCTETNTQKKHINYLVDIGKEVYGVMMNIHLADVDVLLEQARQIQEYGADGVILMDSAGASTPERVQKIVSELHDHLTIDIGFHAHNNMGMAVANSYIAIQNGATIIDGTIGGFGAGAGNCNLEALLTLLLKEKYNVSAKLYPMLDASDKVIKEMIGYNKMIDSTCIVSGYAGVVSTFKSRVESVAKMYNVDPRDIFIELGKKKAIAGQDDLILEVAQNLVKKDGNQL